MTRWLERLAIVIVSLAIAVAIIALLSGGLAGSQDDPGITGGQPGPGIAFRDQGDLHLRPGQPRPAYDSDPPTSGPHNPINVTRDRATISDDQLLQALEVGDIVLMYGTRTERSAAAHVHRILAGPRCTDQPRRGTAEIVTRLSTHSRPRASEISTSHTQVLRPR